MTAPRAASLADPILYAPGTAFNLNVTFPEAYDLSGKWFTFEVRKTKTGSVLFTLNESDAELTISTQTASISVNPDSDGGVTFSSLTKQDSTLHFSADFGDDSDTDLVEYRIQGDISVLPEQGEFGGTGTATSTTVSFESSTVSVTLAGQGPKGDDGAAGQGLPVGGTTGQIPTKASATDYDVQWTNAGAGDMVAATYDPTNVVGDAFAFSNMTGTISTSQIADSAVTLAKQADIATNRILGRSSSGTGVVESLTLPQARTLLNVEDGATADQTGAEIKGLYEGEADTNAFTDTEKSKLAALLGGANKIDATTAPTVNDDASDTSGNGAFAVGSIWVDVTGDEAYRCVDSTATAAVWVKTTLDSTELAAVALSGSASDLSIGTLPIARIANGDITEAKLNASTNTSLDLADSALQSSDIGSTVQAHSAALDSVSGTNTGDQDLSGYALTSSLGTAAASDTGDFEASGAVSTHAAITSGVHGISTFGASLIDDADAATARTTLGVDAAGTDNSTDVTLAGSLDYLSLSGQEITLGSVDLASDVTGILPAANGGTGASALSSLDVASLGSGAATDGYVATADGAGGVAWEAASGGGGGGGGASNIWIPASALIPKTTSGCGVNSSETTTNDQNYDSADFDAGADELADFMLILPNNWNYGTVTFRPYWTADSGSGTVCWALKGVAYADDDALDTAGGTAQTSTDTLLAAGDMHVGPDSSAITIGGTAAANKPVQFTVYRDVSEDTLAVDARLLGIEILYTLAT